jgi:hypothetical protein
VVTSNYPIAKGLNEGDNEAIERRFAEIELTEENKTLIGASKLSAP